MENKTYTSKETGLVVSPADIDAVVCRMLGIPENPMEYALGWNKELGPLIDVGKDREWLLAYFANNMLLVLIIDLLFDTYDVAPRRPVNSYDEARRLVAELVEALTNQTAHAHIDSALEVLHEDDRKLAIVMYLESLKRAVMHLVTELEQ